MGEVARLQRGWEAPDEPMPYEREPPAFESFFEDEKDRLLRTLSVITGSRGEAEDLAQEAFTRLFERWETQAIQAALGAD
jgi:DNA-directed RNA polymerase specialized sigma24 family protein